MRRDPTRSETDAFRLTIAGAAIMAPSGPLAGVGAPRGFVARGEVGDPSTTTAIEDELRDFGPEEVIVVTSARAEPSS